MAGGWGGADKVCTAAGMANDHHSSSNAVETADKRSMTCKRVLLYKGDSVVRRVDFCGPVMGHKHPSCEMSLQVRRCVQ
jgi:metallophosphoesterase superfamily enzyme